MKTKSFVSKLNQITKALTWSIFFCWFK